MTSISLWYDINQDYGNIKIRASSRQVKHDECHIGMTSESINLGAGVNTFVGSFT